MSKIGLAIALGNDATHHTQTFIDGLNYSLKHFPELQGKTLRLVNDHKSHGGGLAAARELVEWDAEVVIGHFSSFAALSSLPVYAEKGIPVVLPASTSCELLNQAECCGGTIFRYQRDNAQMMKFCIDEFMIGLRGGNGYAIVQDNFYGNTLLKHIPILSQLAILRDVPTRIDRNDSYIVLGYSSYAANVIKQLTKYQVHRIMVMDDSDCEQSFGACMIRPDRFTRIHSVSHLIKHGQKRAFWDETLLGLALAVRLVGSPTQQEKRYNSYLGCQYFGLDRCYEDAVLVAEDIK